MNRPALVTPRLDRAEYIRRLVEQAPPLTAVQRSRIASIFQGAADRSVARAA